MNKTKLVIFLGALSFCLGFTLPAERGPEDFDRKTINYFKESNPGGTITAFVGDPALRSNVLQSTYWMTKNNLFKGRYFIGNYYEKTETFTLFCLLDYKQVAFGLDGKKGTTHRLRLEKDREIEASIELGRLPKGGHDLILIAASIDEKRPELSYVQSHRANIFVGSKAFPKPALISSPTEESRTENKVFKISHRKGRDGSARRLSVSINNPLEEDITAVALFFQDFRQVDHSGLFFKLRHYRKIDLSVKAPPAKEKIFCLKVNNPYIILEPKPLSPTSADYFIEISNVILK